jgi:hypothetical protein
VIATAAPFLQSKSLRAVVKLFIVTVCALALGTSTQAFLTAVISPSIAGSRDSVVYWAAGQQLSHHADPYDQASTLRMEQAAPGFPAKHAAMYMRNPPWTLPLVLPLGYFGLQIGSALWSLFMVACLVASVYLLWAMHGRPQGKRQLLGYTFGPAFICLITGQITVLALLGLVLFLRWNRTRPFMAGMALWLCAVKPHLFLPFGVVLLIWIVVTRTWRLLAGAGLALAASCGLILAIDPIVFTQYSRMVHTSGMDRDYIPCLSTLLRTWISPNTLWIVFVPPAVACVWAIWYFWPRRHTWDWSRDGSPLMLVSVMMAPYTWLFDQVLVIPALLEGAYRTRSQVLLAVLAFLSALVQVSLFANILKPSAVYLWTLWSAPAWLIWYLFATGWVPAGAAAEATQWLKTLGGRRVEEPLNP